MDTLNGLLGGIVADPREETRWLVLADWLEENDDPRRAELLRLHRRLVNACCEPQAHPERAEWQSRVVELLIAGTQPCVPQHTLQLPGDVSLVGSFIPPGSFLMGGTLEDIEKPVHKVTLTEGFFMGVYPVTQAQWEAVTGENPSDFKGPNRPVDTVSWDGCNSFCTKLTRSLKKLATVRLPTEAEWECACRAGTTTAYHFGDTINTKLANYDGIYGETSDVGSFPANGWGYTTFTATSGSGAPTGSGGTARVSKPIRAGAPTRGIGSSGAVPGTSLRGSAGPRTATATAPRNGTTVTASGCAFV